MNSTDQIWIAPWKGIYKCSTVLDCYYDTEYNAHSLEFSCRSTSFSDHHSCICSTFVMRVGETCSDHTVSSVLGTSITVTIFLMGLQIAWVGMKLVRVHSTQQMITAMMLNELAAVLTVAWTLLKIFRFTSNSGEFQRHIRIFNPYLAPLGATCICAAELQLFTAWSAVVERSHSSASIFILNSSQLRRLSFVSITFTAILTVYFCFVGKVELARAIGAVYIIPITVLLYLSGKRLADLVASNVNSSTGRRDTKDFHRGILPRSPTATSMRSTGIALNAQAIKSLKALRTPTEAVLDAVLAMLRSNLKMIFAGFLFGASTYFPLVSHGHNAFHFDVVTGQLIAITVLLTCREIFDYYASTKRRPKRSNKFLHTGGVHPSHATESLHTDISSIEEKAASQIRSSRHSGL